MLNRIARSFRPKPPPVEDTSHPIAELENVHLNFGKQHILSGLSLSCAPGERLVVMGKSGGGKSTLLRLILGILRPQDGHVRFKGLEVMRMGRWRLNRMREKIGMVYQYSALISSLSVEDNLALPLEELTDKTPKEIEEIVDEKLELVGLADAKEKMPAELSGGMRKRIGLARALVLNPELILYDEPSAGLDPVASASIDELMISLSEKTNAASIIVTHEMDSAFKVATRMAMLFQGRIHAEGSPEEFRQSSDPVVAQFVSGAPEGPLTEVSQATT
jgi:phospholipid/cholesterol/gamma-HCH transport system ATP-binding protein